MSLAAGRLGYRLRAFLGFSRAVQATLSIAQPAFAAVIAVGGLPPFDRTAAGLLAAFAGFFAVFALNDLMDVDLDRARFEHLRGFQGFDIDSAMARHPLAQGQLGFNLGLVWVGGLALLGLAVAYVLSPIAALLFVTAAVLEIGYCKLARVTELKYLVTGLMVGCGTLAGWAAVSVDLRAAEIAVLFVWMFAWEIGGRNIVNDFADVEEDVRLGIRSVAVVHGPEFASRLTFFFLLATAASSLALQPLAHLGLSYLAFATVLGGYLLILPGLRLWRHPEPENAMALFNRASFYPPLMVAGLLSSQSLPF